MSLLVVGLSHRSAPVRLLERAALVGDELTKFLQDVAAAPAIAESVVLSTCNRVEVYADVAKFHTAVAEVPELLAQHTGVPLDELTAHLYVHYEDRAVQHLFSVTCGLESMVIGEAQILGQVREALGLAQRFGTVGRTLNELVQHALRVGKRAHTETGIDRAGQSLVSVGLSLAAGAVLAGGTTPQDPPAGPAGGTALVVGAGSMSALAAATLQRAGAGRILIANRTYEHGRRLADQAHGEAVRLDDLAGAITAADLVISCTGATGLVIDRAMVATAMASRSARPLTILDLALPRDVDATVRDLPGVTVVDLEDVAAVSVAADGVEAVRAIVAEEVIAFSDLRESAKVTPTVVALRSKADEVVAAELARLDSRLPGLSQEGREEVRQAVRRVVDKILHAPTVRVKQLAAEPGGQGYADALRELFDLDLATVEAVTRPDPGGAAQ